MSLRAPVVAAKTLGPSQVLEFMGITLDSTLMEARLPEDKLTRLRTLLASFKGRRSVCLVDLQSLKGTLQFACKVVVPGRTFLQRIINLSRGVQNRFHHIRLKKEFFKDLSMWETFLTGWNGRSFFSTHPLPLLPTWNCSPTQLVLLGLGGTLMGSGSREGGLHT